MSKSEDYLDDLLNAVSNRNDKKDITDLLDSVREEEAREVRQQKNKKPKRDYGAEYYQDFLKELENDEENEFIRNFELEIDAEEARQDISDEDMAKETEEPEEYLGNIDGIVNEAKKRLNDDTPAADFAIGAEIPETAGQADSLENFTLGGEDPFADFIAGESGGEALTSGSNTEKQPFSDDDLSLEALLPEGMVLSLDDDEQIQDESKLDEDGAGGDSDDGLLELLSGLSADSELSDISALLKADEDEDVSELEKLESIDELSDLVENKNKAKKGKKAKKKGGKVSKFMSMLFGEDEDAAAKDVKVAEEGSLENISDENLEILQEIDGKDMKKGKKNKKGKKEKEKKEKSKKEKKPPKPKKEKKPKEPDLSPPLPKKPVILITIMAASIFVLIMLGSNYVNYFNDVSTARSFYERGNYVDAYDVFSGMSVKKSELSMSKSCSILAMMQEEYLAYVALMDANQYEFALDSLIRGVGRYDKFHEQAEEYGILIEYEQLGIQIEQVLNEQFGVSRDKALELYKMDRTDYSLEILKILKELGLG